MASEEEVLNELLAGPRLHRPRCPEICAIPLSISPSITAS